MKKFSFATAAILLMCFAIPGCANQPAGFSHFITTSGGKLMDGAAELRFISCNIPNLHYIEDNVPFAGTQPFRFPDEYEIRDALLSIQQMGGQVVRTYTLSVRRADDPPGTLRHVLGPNQFNEEGFVALDKCLQVANELGIRLIIPFVDNWIWWGGRGEYAAFRGKQPDDFWTDPQIIADFKQTINFVLNRTNTFTNVKYKDDKAILCWETGNELTNPPEWAVDIAAFIKSIDPNHLVMDGFHTSVLRDESLADPNVDIVTTHHYQKNPQEMAKLIAANINKAAGKKPYVVGEFGFIPTGGVEHVLQAVIDGPCAGALLWSLRGHNRDGGFYWHSEPYGGNLFKAYHWPGFVSSEAFDETACMVLVRQKAFEIRGETAPPVKAPFAPTLLPIADVAAISWQGSAGAASYAVKRAESASGPWTVIAENISDAEVQYRPQFSDTTANIGVTYFYRLFAKNAGGISAPSNVVAAPVVAFHTLVDECRDFSLAWKVIGSPFIKNDESRQAKEDAHRFRGKPGDAVFYRLDQVITSFRVFTFFTGDVAEFFIFGSADGLSFSPINLKRTDYFSGQGEYNYAKPVLFSGEAIPSGITCLQIQFPTEAEIARIEVTYAN